MIFVIDHLSITMSLQIGKLMANTTSNSFWEKYSYITNNDYGKLCCFYFLKVLDDYILKNYNTINEEFIITKDR